jgi:hypothetical protein
MFEPQKKNYSTVPYIAWKGQTFNQITSAIQKNNPTHPMEGRLLFTPPPLKIYRREIVSKNVLTTNPRISASIDLFNQPNGYLVVPKEKPCECNAIQNTLDITLTSNSSEKPGSCSAFTTEGVCLDPATNAKRRVRSAGMIRQKIVPGKIPTPYCTTSQQYLSTRGRTFNQNQFNYLQTGNPNVKPGAPGSVDNKYAVNQEGVNYCADPNQFIESQYKPSNYKYATQGGVSSSARTLRLNYNTITTTGGIYSKAYGSQVGNALAYGQSSEAYTVKDKIGVPMPCIPKFSATSDDFQKCAGPTPFHLTNNAYAALG